MNLGDAIGKVVRHRASIYLLLATLLASSIASLPIYESLKSTNPPMKIRAEATMPISPTVTTTLVMTDGIANHSMTVVNGDGYTTWAFPISTFFSYITFSIQITTEQYYYFSIWTGDLGADQISSRLLMKVNETLIGNEIFNSVGSGQANLFMGRSQNVTIGELRLPIGIYRLGLYNMINDSIESENYIAVKIVPSSREVRTELFSFAIASDLHYDETGASGIWVGVDNNFAYGVYSKALVQQFVNATNNITPSPSFVVITGDLQNGVAPGWYANLKAHLDWLDMPYYLILGNHDEVDPLQLAALSTTFGGLYPEWNAGQYYYYRDLHGVRLIFMDSGPLVNVVNSTQQNWLNNTLLTNQAVFVFIHCPLQNGLSWDSLTQRVAVKQELEANGNVVAVFQGHGHNQWITSENNILYVETPAMIQYPFDFTEIKVYGTAIDILRQQLNTSLILSSLNNVDTTLGIGLTEDINDIAFGGWTDGLYEDVQRVYNNSGLVSTYDRPVLGHNYLGSYYINATIVGMTGNMTLKPISWNPNTVINFKINATSGSVKITLGGLIVAKWYNIYIDGHKVVSFQKPSSSGYLDFTYSGAWSEHNVVLEAVSFSTTVNNYASTMVVASIAVSIAAIFGITFTRMRGRRS